VKTAGTASKLAGYTGEMTHYGRFISVAIFAKPAAAAAGLAKTVNDKNSSLLSFSYYRERKRKSSY
jgi:hypothetical protein